MTPWLLSRLVLFSPRLWRRTPGIRRGKEPERGTSGGCFPSPACPCSASSLRNENPSCAHVLLHFQANFDQANNTTLTIGSFSETVHSTKRDDRQRRRCVFLPDGLFKGVRIVHVAIVRQEDHVVRLCEPPHRPIITVHG